MSIQTPLAKAKGLGSAKEGAHHWWMQRVTAVALIPLICWFVYMVLCATQRDVSVLRMLASPLHATAMVLFLGTTLYHGSLGMRVIIEDYVSCHCTRTGLIVFTNFTSVVLGVLSIVAVLFAHFNGGL